jgi:hypothetical protein
MPIKELVWQEDRDGSGVMALTPLGEFHVWTADDMEGWCAEFWNGPEQIPGGVEDESPGMPEAKAACAAFWEELVGMCLST